MNRKGRGADKDKPRKGCGKLKREAVRKREREIGKGDSKKGRKTNK